MKFLVVVEAWDEESKGVVHAMKKTVMSKMIRSSVSSMMMMRIARLRSRRSKDVRTRNDEGDMVQGIDGKPTKGE